MREHLPVKINTDTALEQAVLSTLVFFGILEIPLTLGQVWQLLYKQVARKEEVETALKKFLASSKVFESSGLYSLKPVDQGKILENNLQIKNRLLKIEKYYWLLSIIPFIENICVINSLAMGNASAESDIDFFVVTRPRRLYFVRSLIIIIFRLLGVYKTRSKIADQFCFGFYVTTDGLDLSSCLIERDDPHFAFWFASFKPMFGRRIYERMIANNRWIYDYCPNFLPSQKVWDYKPQARWTILGKRLLEFLLFVPAAALEPVLRLIHIRHTWHLPENSWPTSTTIAEKDILKLHAVDPRKQVRERFCALLRNLG